MAEYETVEDTDDVGIAKVRRLQAVLDGIENVCLECPPDGLDNLKSIIQQHLDAYIHTAKIRAKDRAQGEPESQ